MELEGQIREILTQELPGVVVGIELNPDTDKIGGHVIWPGFAGLNARRRQDRIFRVIRRRISATVARENVSYIFSYTPDEYEQALDA